MLIYIIGNCGSAYHIDIMLWGFAMGNKIFKISNFKKTVNYLKKNGVRHAYYAARERMEEERKADYLYREPSADALEAQRAETEGYPELFSIVVPAYETGERFLREMIDSVRRQSYPRWELIIVDAGSSDTVEKTVREIMDAAGEKRIRYSRLAENKGISDNTNAGIALAAGDYIALLDHDDLLAPDALYYMVREIRYAKRKGVTPVLLYTDEDKYEDNGSYFDPHRKTLLNLDLILSNNYICHFTAVEAKLMKNLQLRREFDGAQDYDLVLRVIDRLYGPALRGDLNKQVIHIPKVLYHWRCHADSTAANTESKLYAYEAGKATIADFCARRGWHALVSHSLHLGFYDITYLPDILTVREDIGIVGGRVLDGRGRICGGAMNDSGACLYEGLHKEYSGGSTHRASLKQDVAAVDPRCMQIRPELREIFTQVTGLAYEERTIRCKAGGVSTEVRIADVSRLICDEAGYRKLGMELGRAAVNCGYRVLWDPRITV